MATTTAINVTFVDNELYIIAIPSTGTGTASHQIFHYMSGCNARMNVTIVPQHILPAGRYTLQFVGINWGGPANFTASLTTGGTVTPVGPAVSSSAFGLVWSPAVAIDV